MLSPLLECETVWGLLEIAYELSVPSAITADIRATYFDHCMRLVKRVDPDCIAELPLRAIRDEIAKTGALSVNHAHLLHCTAYAPSPFNGEMTQIERDLASQVLADPRDQTPCVALADHLETIGQEFRASLVREQAASLSYVEVAERGLEFRNVDGDKTIATWIEAWGADAPADVLSTVEPVPSQVRSAMVSWIDTASGDDIARLGKEPSASAVVVLGLMSPSTKHVRGCLRAIVQLSLASAGPHLLEAMRKNPRSETLEAMASSYNEVARLSKNELANVLGWLESDAYQLRRAACCLLQGSGKDDRVLEAMLTHFVDGHPYTERAIAKRKTDPRVIPALLAAFGRAEVASLKDGRNLVYTTDYGVLSKYLAKLGNTRGKEAWERYKKKGRMDRATIGARERRQAWEM